MSNNVAYRNSWIAEKLDRINLTTPKGKKEVIKAAADAAGESVNAYINKAVDERMERENAPTSGAKASEGEKT